MSRSLKRLVWNTEYEYNIFQKLHTRKVVSKEITKCDVFRFYVVKSHNSFLLGVNNYLVFTPLEPFLIFFFFKASYLEEKDTSLEFEFMEHYLGNAVYFEMLTISFFKFALNSGYQRNISMFAALVFLCCYWRCLVNVQLSKLGKQGRNVDLHNRMIQNRHR